MIPITNEGIVTQLDYILLLLPFNRLNCNTIINDVYMAFIITTQDAGEETYTQRMPLEERRVGALVDLLLLVVPFNF